VKDTEKSSSLKMPISHENVEKVWNFVCSDKAKQSNNAYCVATATGLHEAVNSEGPEF
jgi:hypothetical protein